MAIDRGVRVYTVGVGTVEGATVEIDGFNVFTQLNEVVLQEIAFLTEGVYFGVDDLEDIRSIYEELETQFVIEPREIEVTSLVGGVSALLLLTGGLLVAVLVRPDAVGGNLWDCFGRSTCCS